jgi:hypothetical protein
MENREGDARPTSNIMSMTTATNLAPKTAPVAQAAPVMASKGIPSFGQGSTVVKNRPKIEVIGEACESCSA